MNPRREAARILGGILNDQGSLSSLAPASADAALVQELCYGVCRHYFELAQVASSLLEKPLRKKDRDVWCLLLVGLYQLFYLRVPDHAAINETVAAVRKPWARGLVNAVLREARRRWPDYSAENFADPALCWSHPAWLIDKLRRDWPDHWTDILRANNERAPMTLRVNRRRTSRDDYLERLLAAGIGAHQGTLGEDALILDAPVPVQALPGFQDGLCSVQDEASQLAAALLRLDAGQRVLDACAAPGGKTCAMLERAGDLDLLSLDNDAARLERIRDNLARLGLQARVECADAARPGQWWDGRPFDRILLDVPCSGTGVIRRHPDIKLLRKAEDVEGMRERQQAILTAAWPLLKPGGFLLYSTCSVLIEENNAQIAKFLHHTPDARAAALPGDWGQPCEIGRQLLPGTANSDGFYYALLEKY